MAYKTEPEGRGGDDEGGLAALIYDPKARGLLFQIILLLGSPSRLA